MTQRRFDPLGQNDGYPLAGCYAGLFEGVGQPVGQRLKLAKGVLGALADRIRAEKRRFVSKCRVPIAHRVRHVEVFGHLPAE